MKPNQSAKPATDSEIRTIIGMSAEDHLVQAIRRTGASYEEVLQAFEWLADDEDMGKQLRKNASGTVAQVCDILQEDLDSEA